MEHGHPARRLDFYTDSARGKTLRTLTLSDLSFWATDAFVAIVLVLFIIQNIEGGSATHVGLAYLLYKGIAAALSIPAGRFFDRHKGKIDEVWGLAVSSFAYGAGYVLLSFSNELWELYAVMAVLGAMSTINLLSWRTLFFNGIDKAEYTETVGTYQTIMFVGQGFALALGGFAGDTFGFQTVVFFGGIVIFFGGFLPLTIKYLFRKRST
jgi:MFS family permease